MATITSPLTAERSSPDVPDWTAADLVERFGPIPLWRVRMVPAPGTATEQDVIDIQVHTDRLCELVDGVLVEKTAGVRESYLAVLVASAIGNFLAASNLGIVLGADGMAKLAPGLIRIPDVSFVRWERFPGRVVPSIPYLESGPDLAVEVLSPSNTAKEMDRKLKDYFASGVRLVWYVDPVKQTAEVFTAVGQSTVLGEGDTLDGGDVLPGFALPLARMFAELGPKAE
jgi:Uma2 family endonuclease